MLVTSLEDTRASEALCSVGYLSLLMKELEINEAETELKLLKLEKYYSCCWSWLEFFSQLLGVSLKLPLGK